MLEWTVYMTFSELFQFLKLLSIQRTFRQWLIHAGFDIFTELRRLESVEMLFLVLNVKPFFIFVSD